MTRLYVTLSKWMKSMHHAAGLIHVLGLNPMSVIAVQVRTDVRQASVHTLPATR